MSEGRGSKGGMVHIVTSTVLVTLLFTGAMFGFFFAWVSSTMWGLDQADPAVAIRAMQAMNASVRNSVFGTVFFGTPVVLALALLLLVFDRQKKPSLWLGAGLGLYLSGVLAVTVAINVPLNEGLAATRPSDDPSGNAAIWIAYSAPWQQANLVRTLAGGLALLCCAIAFQHLGRRKDIYRA